MFGRVQKAKWVLLMLCSWGVHGPMFYNHCCETSYICSITISRFLHCIAWDLDINHIVSNFAAKYCKPAQTYISSATVDGIDIPKVNNQIKQPKTYCPPSPHLLFPSHIWLHNTRTEPSWCDRLTKNSQKKDMMDRMKEVLGRHSHLHFVHFHHWHATAHCKRQTRAALRASCSRNAPLWVRQSVERWPQKTLKYYKSKCTGAPYKVTKLVRSTRMYRNLATQCCVVSLFSDGV